MLRPHSAPPLKASVLSRERSAAIDDLSSQTAQSTRRGLTRSYPTDSLAVLLSVLIMASSEAPQTRYNEMIQQLIIAAAATVALTTGAHTLPFRLRRRSTRGWLFFVTVSSQASGFAEKAVVTSGRSTRLPSATPASLRHGERRRRRYHLILWTDGLLRASRRSLQATGSRTRARARAPRLPTSLSSCVALTKHGHGRQSATLSTTANANECN